MTDYSAFLMASKKFKMVNVYKEFRGKIEKLEDLLESNHIVTCTLSLSENNADLPVLAPEHMLCKLLVDS